MIQIEENVSLKNLNTFGVEAKARWFTEVNTEDEIVQLFSDPQWRQVPRLILGGGSNMLFIRDFEGLVIRINIRGLSHHTEGDTVFVKAGAGEVWHDLVMYCVNQDFAGIENMALIPGSVGASPVQNIGAYGVELEQVFESCRAYHIKSGTFREFSKEDCGFSYRESFFKQEGKGQYIITSVVFRLSKSARINTSYGAISAELEQRNILSPTIKDIAQVVSDIRVAKLPDPSTIGNSGSFFKNPVIDEARFLPLKVQFPDIVHYPAPDNQVKLAAGWLIEQCGWKGKVHGRTGTWKNQALVLVNHGGATGQEVFDLSTRIIDDVQQKFGVSLEREVNMIA
ncbi:MAG: UDP-N-acetylmuramate dehydrogenase [Mucilaginibacter polytrichastri]|nr:UDP-N-acetylmuramate dehydrogenase [Mucilaginibacter polytrichastri]